MFLQQRDQLHHSHLALDISHHLKKFLQDMVMETAHVRMQKVSIQHHCNVWLTEPEMYNYSFVSSIGEFGLKCR